MPNDTATTFEAHRDRLFGIAYRMLGDVAAAEDVVQDAYLRWHSVDAATVDTPAAYLTTVVTHLCRDALTAAQRQREVYPGPWLPAPLVDARSATSPQAEQDAALSMGVLVLLETLTPIQRAVYVLRESFDVSYTTIARIVDRSPAACRKIAQRARQHVGTRNHRFATTRREQEDVVRAFVSAIEDGDPERLGAVLAEDATSYSDGGGEVTAALRPIYGHDRITRFLLGIAGNAPEGLVVEHQHVNGEPGLLLHVNGQVQSVWAFDVLDGRLHTLYTVLNPSKLHHIDSTTS